MTVRYRCALVCLLSLLALGCPDGNKDPDTKDTASEGVDDDGDGYLATEDCDDTNPAVFPGAEEICDDVDNDCDGEADEGVEERFYADVDGDGFGDAESVVFDCEAPDGYLDDDSDCDDSDAAQYPGADEYCNGEDDDCDDEVDEDHALDGETWYADSDGDGYGDVDETYVACNQPSGYVSLSTDCDDDDPEQHPGAEEYCNGEDDDCDGVVDEDTVDAATNWYADADGDGYGDDGDLVVQCTQPSGYVLDDSDCNDSDSSAYPGSVEYCDGADNDCDGEVDEEDAVDGVTWYADADGDAYGDAGASSYACYQPSGYVLDDSDCDDSDALQYPGAEEYCNAEDDDCDGDIDEDDAFDVSTWYADGDGDGYGDAATSDIDCDEISGYVLDDTDCDDSDALQHPGADEYCNGEDDDCDGEID